MQSPFKCYGTKAITQREKPYADQKDDTSIIWQNKEHELLTGYEKRQYGQL